MSKLTQLTSRNIIALFIFSTQLTQLTQYSPLIFNFIGDMVDSVDSQFICQRRGFKNITLWNLTESILQRP